VRHDVAAEALGGPLRLSIGTEAGRVKAHASGTAMLERVRERYAYPLVEQLAGSVQWQLDFTQPSKPLANAQAATAAADGGLQLTATTLQPRWPLDSIMQGKQAIGFGAGDLALLWRMNGDEGCAPLNRVEG